MRKCLSSRKKEDEIVQRPDRGLREVRESSRINDDDQSTFKYSNVRHGDSFNHRRILQPTAALLYDLRCRFLGMTFVDARSDPQEPLMPGGSGYSPWAIHVAAGAIVGDTDNRGRTSTARFRIALSSQPQDDCDKRIYVSTLHLWVFNSKPRIVWPRWSLYAPMACMRKLGWTVHVVAEGAKLWPSKCETACTYRSNPSRRERQGYVYPAGSSSRIAAKG